MTDKILIAMDRDYTVDVDDMPRGVVPIELIKKLSDKYTVLAIGNQRLVEEADIKSGRMEEETKESALVRLEVEYPDMDRYIIVDDIKRDPLEWEHYNPQRFMDKVEGLIENE